MHNESPMGCCVVNTMFNTMMTAAFYLVLMKSMDGQAGAGGLVRKKTQPWDMEPCQAGH